MGKHILVILDDAGTMSIPSFAAEDEVEFSATMPNLATIQSKGVTFTRCYGADACSNARSMIHTGRYAFRTGLGGNANLVANGPPSTSETFIPEILSGYTSGVFGKWHLGTLNNGQFDSARNACGFGTHNGILGNIIGSDTYWYWQRWVDGTGPTYVGSSSSSRTATDYQTKVMTDDALTWLTTNGSGSNWFLELAYQAPHTPIHMPNTAAERTAGGLSAHMTAGMETVLQAFTDIANEVDVAANTALLNGLGWETDQFGAAAHIGMLEAVDFELGRILAHADVDLDTDTTLWLVTDNGPISGAVQSPYDSTHGKNTHYELGTRMPLIVAGAGVADKGKTCRRLASLTDIFVTICAMEGVSTTGLNLDGVDLRPYLADVEEPTRARDFAYSETFDPHPEGGIASAVTGATNDSTKPLITSWTRCIRDESYKLITRMPTGPASTTGDISYEMYGFKGGDKYDETNLIRDNLLTRAGVDHVPELWEALQRLLAAEAALLP